MEEDPKTWREKWYDEWTKERLIAWKIWRIEHPVKEKD
jgi:hypothetical protein